MQTKIKTKLVMWENIELPERIRENNEWKDTGKKLVKTNYTFRDLVGQTIKIMSEPKEQWQDLEGENVELDIDLVQTEFQGRVNNKLKINDIKKI